MSLELERSPIKNLYETTIRYPGYVAAIRSIEECRQKVREGAPFAGMALLGPGGVGKSTILDSYERANPRRTGSGGMVIPVLRTSVSASNSPIAMLQGIIKAYSPIYVAGIAKGVAPHEDRLAEVMWKAKTEVLLLDEAQNFLAYSNKSAIRTAASALKNLMTKLRITLVIAGTEEAEELIQGDDQLPSRIPHKVYLRPFNIDTREGLREFRGILSAIESAVSLSEGSMLHEEENAQRIYYACNGVFRNLLSLLHSAITIAGTSGSKRITREILYQAFRNHIGQETKDAHNPFSDSFIPHRLVSPGEPYASRVQKA